MFKGIAQHLLLQPLMRQCRPMKCDGIVLTRPIMRSLASSTSQHKLSDEERSNECAEAETNDDEKKERVYKRVRPKRGKRELLFGIHPADICLSERKRTVYKVFCSKLSQEGSISENLHAVIGKAASRDIPIKKLNRHQLDHLTKHSAHQGIVMEVSPLNIQPWTEAMESFGRSDDSSHLCIYLDRVQDPMNMGAILRSAVFLGIDGIFVPTKDSCRLSPVVAKASSGALDCAPLYEVDDSAKFFSFLQKLGWDIVGTDQDCTPFSTHQVTERNRLLVLGNESHGIHEDIIPFLSTTLSIPSKNRRISSLNVSVAAGVLMSHFARAK